MDNCRPVEAGILNLAPALKGDPNTVKCIFRFDQDMDASALEEAMNRTLETYPLLGKKIENRDGAYVYADNPLPFVISEGLKEIKPFLAEGNFHSMTFAYEKNELCILMDHIFFDGSGMKVVLETLFYHYFCIVDKKIYDVPAGVFVGHVDGLTDEPFTKHLETDAEPLFDNDSDERDIFKFPEVNHALSPEELIHATEFVTISAESGEFMRYAKSIGGTPLSALANLFFTVFQNSHPENDKILKNMTSVSLRGILEAPNTILNAAYSLAYFSAPEDALKVDAESERARNVEMRNILKRYRAPENLKKIANKLYDADEKTKSWLKNPSIGEMPTIVQTSVSFYIVYVGTFHFGEYVRHMTDMQIFSKANPVYSCIVFEHGNKFFINLRQPFHSDLYRNHLIEELHKRGVDSAKIEIQG